MQQAPPFLRSINIVFDASEPERIGHYEPTSKAIAFLRGVSGHSDSRAFFVIAPYGSGKSISATYLLQLVENRKHAVTTLEIVSQRLQRVEPQLGDFAQKRLAQGDIHGVVIALEGAIQDIGLAVRDAAYASLQRLEMQELAQVLKQMDVTGITGALAVLDYLKDKSAPSKSKPYQIDRIVLLWDEFGRHVEQLIRSGHPQRLAEIQTLAEYAARTQKLPVTLGLLMHQGLLQYATGLSQSMLSEWRKIEGRFEPIQYVDDSRELYRLIGKIVDTHKPRELSLPHSDEIADRALEVGLLTDLEGELPGLLARAYPLHPAALHILPRLAARASQHERTLFGFVLSADLEQAVTPEHLYDYFASAMQTDTGIGGTYRKWLETESALSKVDDKFKVRALKTASILELGLSGERSRVSRALLEFALGDDLAAKRTIDQLLERKLLLHRRRTDQISLWHGTDVDLRSRLEEELERLEGDFDIIALLNKEFHPAVWRPVRYNDEYSIRRYFECDFIAAQDLLAGKNGLPQKRAQADGRVLYVVPQDEKDCSAACQAALNNHDSLTVIAVPREMIDIRATAAELICLTRMQNDEALLAEDPLISTELQQMLDETQSHLHTQLSRLTQPGPETLWFSGGQSHAITNRADLLSTLSAICENHFRKTPVIKNEMIVRHKPSPQLINARRKVIMGILERYGEERLGIVGEFADASVFRTVLSNTGLYKKATDDEDAYAFAQPQDLQEQALEEVWQKFKNLLTIPDEQPKDLADFFSKLAEPPYGMRDGVMPILFAAALKAFPSALSISDENGNYLEDLLPSHIESICRRPSAFTLTVMKLDSSTREYLINLGDIFGADILNASDLVRAVYDGVEAWRAKLPPGALGTSEIPADVRGLQHALNSELSPVQLFFHRFPLLAGVNNEDYKGIVHWVESATKTLASVVDSYRDSILASINNNLQLIADAVPDSSTMVRFERWRQTLPPYVREQLSGLAKALLTLPLNRFSDDYAFADALAAIVAEKKPQRWTDSDLVRFRNNFAALVSQIETQALALNSDSPPSQEGRAAITQLYTHRIQTLMGNLSQLIGRSDAQAQLRCLLDQIEEAEHGNS
ncbi:hypothetical protein [Chromohalobacter sp.]|uniref:hypothetical protein n=1 Tax=Chromohalobacter sp. TaxID=50740 RepID=UPI001D2C6973|nr:hypothetical protein [Chromohalobacter sp.]NQY47212.1 hypothetical protein [Chromohalobacter sp.]